MPDKIRILIVEDDPQIALRTESLIHALGYEIVPTIDNSEDALIAIRELKPDILVMDIDIKGNLNGIEVVEQVKDMEIPVIFTTGLEEEKIYEEARKTQPAAYLVKPFNKLTFHSALENAVISLSKSKKEVGDEIDKEGDWTGEVFLKDSFFVKRNSQLFKIRLDDIQYIQSDGNYCDILSNKKFAVKMSLTQILKKLPAKRFVRIHQRYVIQTSLIESLDTSSNLVYVGGRGLPLGPKFKDDLLNLLYRL